jgi:hypothetical protein
MSFKVTRLTVGKGRTIGDEKAGEWIRQYYEVELTIDDEHDLELAKASVQGLIDGWLIGTSTDLAAKQGTQARPESKSGDQTADTEGILWITDTGPRGVYEKSEDINNPRFQAVRKTLQAHEGSMMLDGYFLWTFDNGRAIGRKRKA